MDEGILTAIFIAIGMAVGALLVSIGIYFAFVHPTVLECRAEGGTVIGGKCVDVKEIRL